MPPLKVRRDIASVTIPIMTASSIISVTLRIDGRTARGEPAALEGRDSREILELLPGFVPEDLAVQLR